MKDPRHSGRVALDSDYERTEPHEGRDEEENTARRGAAPLTHRPRDLSELHPGKNAGAPYRSISAHTDGLRLPEGFEALDADASDLRPLADQLVSIAEQLRRGDISPADGARASLGQSRRAANGLKGPSTDHMDLAARLNGLAPEERRQTFAEMARVAYAKRRKRVSIFGDPELFGEPAWDILLDLYIAQVEEKSVSVSSACIGSASPPTTGLRWLGVLAEQGLLEREHDPQDQRRVLVRLTEKALEAMDDYFAGSLGLATDRRRAKA